MSSIVVRSLRKIQQEFLEKFSLVLFIYKLEVYIVDFLSIFEWCIVIMCKVEIVRECRYRKAAMNEVL